MNEEKLRLMNIRISTIVLPYHGVQVTTNYDPKLSTHQNKNALKKELTDAIKLFDILAIYLNDRERAYSLDNEFVEGLEKIYSKEEIRERSILINEYEYRNPFDKIDLEMKLTELDYQLLAGAGKLFDEIYQKAKTLPKINIQNRHFSEKTI